ncbi:MAG: hypothetical protein ACI8PB_000332 [Desulforhopalus sp.]
MGLYSTLAQLTTADKINLFNAFGAWFAAIGTISAVIVALYLARLDRIVRVRLSVGHRLVGTGSVVAEYQDHCSIRAVNKGSRKVTITGVGWRVGFFKKRFYDQILSIPPYPSTMPITLADSEEATWLIPFNSIDEPRNWINNFPREILGKHPYWASKSIRILVYTSVGKTIIAPIEKPLRDMLINKL